jgi:translation initiation factor IF-3
MQTMGEFLARRNRKEEPKQTGPKKNNQIRVPNVLVIDELGNKLGQMNTREAINMAQGRGLDLVEVAANAKPPVCRFADFGKMLYEKKKRDSKARKNATVINIKEIKLTPKTGIHDFDVKVKHARKFIGNGDKLKVTIRFRGREMAHREYGEAMCMKVFEQLKDLAEIDQRPKMDGRQMVMYLVPIRIK